MPFECVEDDSPRNAINDRLEFNRAIAASCSKANRPYSSFRPIHIHTRTLYFVQWTAIKHLLDLFITSKSKIRRRYFS